MRCLSYDSTSLFLLLYLVDNIADLILSSVNYLIDLFIRKINSGNLFNSLYRIACKVFSEVLIVFYLIGDLANFSFDIPRNDLLSE